MRMLIRWIGYGLIAAGAALFLASYFVTFNRGGFSAIAERFFHPLADAYLLAMCVGPGLLILGLAEWLGGKSKRADGSEPNPSTREQPSIEFMSALPHPNSDAPLEIVELRGLLFMYYENACTAGDVSANLLALYKYPQVVVITRERQPLLIIRVEEGSVGSMLCAIMPTGERINFGSFSRTDRNTFLTKAAKIVSELAPDTKS